MSASPTGYPGTVVSLLKGGVTKTSTALNLADRLAAANNDVVIADLDKDGHLTTLLGEDEALNAETHVGDIMFGDTAPGDILRETPHGFDLLPSTDRLEEVEDKVKNETYGVNKLRRQVVAPLVDEMGYDYVVIDPPGGRGLLHDSALVAVQRVVIPLIPSTGSISGLDKLLTRSIRPLREEIPVDIVAITPNMMRESIAQESDEQALTRELNTRAEFREHLPSYARVDPEIFDVVDEPGAHLDNIPKPGIRYRKAINDAFRHGAPVSKYDSPCDQIENFDILAGRVMEVSEDG